MSEISTISAINKWYQTPLGAALLKAELVGLADVLPQIFGYYIAQIGGPTDNNEILAASRINNRIIVNPYSAAPINGSLTVQCQLDELPFLPESIDAFVLFHILESASNPKAILKEIYTSLMPNGYVIIFGFNPYSLWGLTSPWKKTNKAPWSGNWIGPGHMRKWLSKIGFSIGDYKTFYFRPPNNNPEKLLFMEGLGQIFWPYCGASYMIVAQKTVAPLTPIRPLLSLAKYFKTAKALPKPTTRTSQCNNKL
ncbi:MAG: generic methyl-transferase [uncultured bacterium]|nr:MAG: generic methyl-transferase [uncultured bacterium]